jgi:hypothetical protein
MVTAETLRYMFSIQAGFPTRWVAKTPTGYRIDAEFHTTTSGRAISTADDRYWLAWGAEVKDWLHQHPLASDWMGLFKKDEQKRVAEAFASKPAGAKQARVEVESDVKHAEFGAVLKRLREFVREKELDCPAWLGLSGSIVSGVDWALLRSDGVVEFDGQWVLTDGDLDDKKAVLVNARSAGSVDLCGSKDQRPLTLDHAVSMIHATKEDEHVGIALAIKFEAPQEPEPWASKKYTRRKGQLRYALLSRGQFVATGNLKAFGKSGAEVELDVYQVKV